MKIGLKIFLVLFTVLLQSQCATLNSSLQQNQLQQTSQNQGVIQQKQQMGAQRFNWTKQDEMFAFGELDDNSLAKHKGAERKLFGNLLEGLGKQVDQAGKQAQGMVSPQQKTKHKKIKHKKKHHKIRVKLHKKKHHKKRHHKQRHHKQILKRRVQKHVHLKERMLRQVSNDNKIIVRYEKMTKDEIKKQKRLQRRKRAHQGRLLEAQKLHFNRGI